MLKACLHLIQSGGWNLATFIFEDDQLSHLQISQTHSLNDTLKNTKNGHDNLKYLFSQYRSASFETMKKINLFFCQIIDNKITLIKYAIKSRTTWKVVECRSATVPLTVENSLEYMRVFELFAFLMSNIKEQQSIFKQLKLENLSLISVPNDETVAYCLL
ncbi:hypothetical protein EDC96DRAFT_544845 [Choanephora cucurbitarum]|nr:hypothetical protein EDC96DRAFT_544845 [Choanephora cucurbitarum]